MKDTKSTSNRAHRPQQFWTPQYRAHGIRAYNRLGHSFGDNNGVLFVGGMFQAFAVFPGSKLGRCRERSVFVTKTL